MNYSVFIIIVVVLMVIVVLFGDIFVQKLPIFCGYSVFCILLICLLLFLCYIAIPDADSEIEVLNKKLDSEYILCDSYNTENGQLVLVLEGMIDGQSHIDYITDWDIIEGQGSYCKVYNALLKRTDTLFYSQRKIKVYSLSEEP